MQQKIPHQTPTPPQKSPTERGGFNFLSTIRIFDPNTNKDVLKMRTS